LVKVAISKEQLKVRKRDGDVEMFREGIPELTAQAAEDTTTSGERVKCGCTRGHN